jgi:riboflavin kinase/FMN adenylyltransferase
MRWTLADRIPEGFGPSVVTLGNFDGVHRGHQAVLARTVARAAERGARAAAITFDPHPSAVHNPGGAVPAIASHAQRLDLMEAAGLDAVLTVPYTVAFAATPPARFAREYLVDALRASLVVVGRDIRFGRGNSGDLATLTGLGGELGFEVEGLADLGEAENGGRPRWSSTGVRHLLADGDVEEAGAVLGRAHRVVGTVVRGDARGRRLGYPTANLGPAVLGMIPADGVYAGWLTRLDLPDSAPDNVQPAAISVGANPTFAGTSRRVEAHVPGRTDLELYGERVALDFVVRLRRTLAFSSPEALVAQMADDVRAAIVALRSRS